MIPADGVRPPLLSVALRPAGRENQEYGGRRQRLRVRGASV